MNYRFGKDSRSWTIQEKCIAGKDSKTPGAISWKTIGWYPSLEMAATNLLDKAPRDNVESGTSIQELIDAINSARDSILTEIGRVTSNGVTQ